MSAAIPSFGYAPEDFARLPFSFEMTRLRAGGRGFAHRHSYHHLLWIAAGEGVHSMDGVEHPLGPGHAFLIAPQQVHHWTACTPVQGYAVKFSREFLEQAGAGCAGLGAWVSGGAGAAALPEPAAAGVQAQLDALLAESAADHADRHDLLAARLRLLLLTLRRLWPQPTQAVEGDDLARRFARLLQTRGPGSLMLADCAALLGTSPGRLNDAVKRATGLTVPQQLREHLLLEAKRRLMFTAQPVAELAETLGFDDPAYFGRFFKQRTRMTPGDFRRGHQMKVPAGA